VALSPLARVSSTASQLSQGSNHTSQSGGASSSTLRKLRKKRVPPSTEPPVPSELDDGVSGKRLTKKQQVSRVFEWLRFRPLKAGDLVAARLTSRDLWILAKVNKDYHLSHRTGATSPGDFLQLSTTRRDQLFQREKVVVTDVEDKEENLQTVSRTLILPLPRSFGEASEWCARYKKGSRVYAMYPQTTSLYAATVVDSTTYCRDEDDICVVEFDGDEADDSTGALPQCHVPARFVCMIPNEFPAASAPASMSAALTAPSMNKSLGLSAGTMAKKSRDLPTQRQRRDTAASASSVNDSNLVAAAAAAALNGGDLSTDLDDLDFEGGLPGLDFDELDFAVG
jgi:hypothetical protein